MRYILICMLVADVSLIVGLYGGQSIRADELGRLYNERHIAAVDQSYSSAGVQCLRQYYGHVRRHKKY